jgi:hypothetical protein
MSEVYTVAKYWAVLIGINFYAEEPLKGCVRDVENVEQYLKAGSTPVTVVALTASTPPDQDPHHPPEQPNLWPTYENVISNLTNLTKVLDFNCTPHIDQVTTQLGLVPRQCSLTFRIL